MHLLGATRSWLGSEWTEEFIQPQITILHTG